MAYKNFDTQITCSLATTPAEMEQVYRLRHACYLRQGAIEPRPDGLFADRYDELPNHFSFLMRSGDEPIGTVRISVVKPELGWTQAPSCTVFGDHPTLKHMAQESFVEASRFSFAHTAPRNILYRLVANQAMMADFHNTKWLVACPRSEHAPIYQRMFGFTRIAPPRKYFGVSFETELLAVSREDLRNCAERFEPMRRAWSAAAQSIVCAAA